MTLLSQILPGLSQGPMLRILGALLILVFGHLAIKLGLKTIRRYRSENRSAKQIKKIEERFRLTSNLLDATVIILALIYLNVGISSQLQSDLIQNAPNIFSALLVGVLGIIAINIAENIFKGFFQTLGLKKYLKEADISSASFNIFSTVFKVFLYLILAQVLLYQLQLNIELINQLFNAFTWAFAFLVAGLIFYSLKDLVKNLGAGFYLKNSRILRPGEEVKLEDEYGEIRDITLFGTSLETNEGYTVLTPNSKILDSGIRFKRSKNDLQTLQEITSYFKTSENESEVVSVTQLSLEIFEEYYTENEITDRFDTETPEEIMEVIENLSERRIRTAFISSDKITSLEDEYKSWFNDGALIISKMDKSKLFKDAEDKYNLSIGIESGEVLNIDPVRGSESGVYYVDSERTQNFMGPKDGYIALAPEGTNAYWRIKNDLIYGSKNMYDELSKTLENRLRKIMRQGRVLTEVMPDAAREYIEDWSRNDNVSREWSLKRG